MRHAHLSLFSYLVGQSPRISHVPVDTVIFVWQIAGVLLLLTAAWRLLDACFVSLPARWGGVALLAAVLTVPVAGTALVLMDPYLTARSLSTPASLFAVGSFVSGKPWQTAAWLLLTALMHPQMGLFAVVFIACIAGSKAVRYMPVPALPGIFDLEPAQGPAREALLARTYFWLSNWAWYEWLGLLATGHFVLAAFLIGCARKQSWLAVALTRNCSVQHLHYGDRAPADVLFTPGEPGAPATIAGVSFGVPHLLRAWRRIARRVRFAR